MTLLVVFILFATSLSRSVHSAGQPGGAGYALVLNNNPLIKDNFKDFPTDALTFEAWVSTYYTCHPGTLMSYALDTDIDDDRLKNLNHFTVSHLSRVIGCHDYQRTYLGGLSGAILAAIGVENCLQDYLDYQDVKEEIDPRIPRDGTWTHVAITWSAENDGETIVYKNGEIAGRVSSNSTRKIKPNGIFMLGGKQNCFGGCSVTREAFYGLMDEVRIWNVSRSQIQIQDFMTQTGTVLRNEEGLVAHWNFDDPMDEDFDDQHIAKDMSGHGNDLELLSPPMLKQVRIKKNKRAFKTGALVFENNYAINRDLSSMPKEDITIEFWARLLLRPYDDDHPQDFTLVENRYYLFSYVTQPSDKDLDDLTTSEGINRGVIAMYIDLNEWNDTGYLRLANFSSRGSVWVGFGGNPGTWIEFDTKWLDGKWHHVAFTYDSLSSKTHLFYDGKESIPFWKNNGAGASFVHPDDGGIKDTLPIMKRLSHGSLTLGQFQDCYGGCFPSSSSFSGMIANFRIWNRALSKREIKSIMMESLRTSNLGGLAIGYEFDDRTITGSGNTARYASDQNGDENLYLGSIMPHFEFSTAPLTRVSGRPFEPPSAEEAGYALQLNDQKIVVLESFEDFPTDAITVEFSMWSIDQCNAGVPFSYNVEIDDTHVDMFTISNYNNWLVTVNGDSGDLFETQSSVSSTDGLWHHMAVTWDKQNGETLLYDNGRLHWKGIRNKGKSLKSGGILVLGREQDCLGGCFDSASGAFKGNPISSSSTVQDFFGFIDNVRIWNKVRSPSQINKALRFNIDLEEGRSSDYITNTSKGLVAWWKFDEGRGKRVKDATNNGHTLHIRGRPSWIVPNYFEGCGDGILSQAEQCDDGNRRNGDGCSKNCRFESARSDSSLTEDESIVRLTQSTDNEGSSENDSISLDDDIL